MEARATLALKPGVWFRRGRLLIVSPDSLGTACPLSGRNSTYRLVQILEAGSLAVVAGQMEVLLHRSDTSGEDWLTLIITLPNGREFVAHAPRDELKDIADETFDE